MSGYRRSSYSSGSSGVLETCFLYLVALVVFLGFSYFLDGWAVTYIANVVFHHTIIFWQAAVIGLLSGDLVLPAVVIVWFLHLMGVF
jgi:hypothetical protein